MEHSRPALRMRHINQAGLTLIKEFEGCKLKAYRDVVGILTIGYGHTGKELRENDMISADQAEVLLREDLHKTEESLSQILPLSLNDNQFSALVCFAFNCGTGNLRKSTLLRCVEHGYFDKAADEFLKWDIAGGKVVLGLARRREAERKLFLTPVSQVG